MKRIKLFMIRTLLRNKRLLKKTSFILILCMIPLLTLSMALFSKDESGILTINLCAEDKNDALANSVINDLMNDDGVLNFVVVETKDEAYENVKNGTADAAWIMSKNMQSKIDRFAMARSEAFVTVIERESDISLQLSHEKLSGVVFPYVSRSIFSNYMLNDVFAEGEITIEQINEVYDNAFGGGNLIIFEKIDGSVNKIGTNYLTAPLRGLLSLAVLLCGLASIMYHQSDRENKVYDWLAPIKHIVPGISTTASAVFDSTVIVVISLAISGLFISPIWEILSALVFCVAVTAFCTFIGCITKKASRTGHIIPFLILLALVLSPIFFNFVSLKPFQICLPTYYYLYAVYQPIFILYMLVYSAVAFGMSFLINLATER